MKIQVFKIISCFVLSIFSLLTNAQISCPDYIECGNIWGGAPAVSLVYNGMPNFDFNEDHQFEIFWGHGSSDNGIYDWYLGSNHPNGTFGVTLYTGWESPLGCSISEFTQITLPDGTSCSFNYGILCNDCPFPETELEDCTDWLNECGDDLYEVMYRSGLQGKGCEQWAGECGIDDPIERTGLTMIGVETAPPSSYQYSLAVRGGILTSKIKVTPYDDAPGWGSIENGNQNEWWCDYVFADSYNLMSLLDLEKFIAKNKHLPRTPSAAEVKAEGGYEIGSVLFNHQEKVEEIFLHLIDLDKQIAEMKQELNED